MNTLNKILISGITLVMGSVFSYSQVKNPKNLPYTWTTDTTKHTVDMHDLTIAVEKDALPTLDFPKFITREDKKFNFYEYEPVIAVNFNGEPRAYPLSLLTMYRTVK